MRQDAYAPVWDDTARYIARLHNVATNRPVRVILVRQWEPIPAPETEPGQFRFKDYQQMPANFDNLKFSYRFNYYDVKPQDLK